MAGKFRQAAAAEMHSTTRRAMHHNQTLTSVLATLRARLLHLRQENHKLKDNLQEARVKEKIGRSLAEQLAVRCEKRAILLRSVTERAEVHVRQHQQDVRFLNETEQLRKDLRLQQAQLDATTELISQLKEKAMERDIALELTAIRLQEEDATKKSLLGTIRSVMKVLQVSAFQETCELSHADTEEDSNVKCSTQNTLDSETNMDDERKEQYHKTHDTKHEGEAQKQIPGENNLSELFLNSEEPVKLAENQKLARGKQVTDVETKNSVAETNEAAAEKGGFVGTEAPTRQSTEGKVPFESLVKQILELLAAGEEKASGAGVDMASSTALLTYSDGDLGLLPRGARVRK